MRVKRNKTVENAKDLIQSNDVICLRSWKGNLTFEMEKHQSSWPSNIVFLWIKLLYINIWLCWHTHMRTQYRIFLGVNFTNHCTDAEYLAKKVSLSFTNKTLLTTMNKAKCNAKLLYIKLYAERQKNGVNLQVQMLLIKLAPDDWFGCCCKVYVKHVPNQMHEML